MPLGRLHARPRTQHTLPGVHGVQAHADHDRARIRQVQDVATNMLLDKATRLGDSAMFRDMVAQVRPIHFSLYRFWIPVFGQSRFLVCVYGEEGESLKFRV